jgi:predicted ATPase
VRITRLTLRNWRTFKNLDVPVGQRLVVIGSNASGKSNLLDSIRFLRDIAVPGGGLQDAVRLRGGLSRVRCLFARNNHHGWVAITVVLGEGADDQWTYSLSFRSETRGLHRPVVAEEIVKRGEQVLLQRPDEDDDEDPERLTQTALEQISENKDFRAVGDFFAETRYLHLVPQVIRDASRAGDAVDDPFGGDFIARMNRVPPKTRDAWLRRVTAALQIAVPQFSSLDVKVDAAGRPHLESRYTNWRTSGARQDERDLSDGTLRLIGLLWSLVEVGRKGAPVLLEEPELSLHPAVIRMLPSVLARAQRSNGAQVLLTTHSPELLTDEGIRADEVLLLIPTADGTEGVILSSDPQAVKLIDSGLTVAEVALPRTEPPNIEALAQVNMGAR